MEVVRMEWEDFRLAARHLLRMLGSERAQGATEYLLILAVAAIVVVVVLAMVNGMRAAAPTQVTINGTNQTMTQAIRNQFGNMTQISIP